MLTTRQHDIVMYLKKADDYVSVSKIADFLKVSQKTVRNEVNTIREVLRENELGEIESKPHVGIRLCVSQKCWEKWESDRTKKSVSSTDDEKLVMDILEELLKKQTVSYTLLEKKLCVTRSVIERLLPKVTEWFADYEISVEKEKGIGLTLKIPYLKYRYLWSAALMRLWNEIKKYRLPESKGYHSDQEEVYKIQFYESFLQGFDLNGVLQAVRKTEENFGFRFTYNGVQQVVIMTAISVRQVRCNNAMDFFATNSNKADTEFDEMVASYLISQLESKYQIAIPMTERDYIVYSVEVADIQRFTDMEAKLFCQSRSLEMCHCAVKIATLMEDITGRTLRKDELFTESLFLQLRSIIGRRKYDLCLKNPLVKQVRKKYNDIFVAVQSILVFMEKELGVVMNEDETCSLVLLLGGALLRSAAIVDACLICNYYGIGSAHFLRERLEREVKDLNIVEEFSERDLMQVRKCSCDLIISTIPLENVFENKKVVQVENLLLDYDIAAIEMAMSEIRKMKVQGKNLSKMLTVRRMLFREEFVWINVKCEDKYSLIRAMSEKLAAAGYVTEKFADSAISRERKLSTEIGKKLAIPHGDAQEVIRSVVAVAVLEQAVPWGDEETADRIFLMAFNPDESQEMKEMVLHFYKKLVGLQEEEMLYGKFRDVTNEKELVDMLNTLVE